MPKPKKLNMYSFLKNIIEYIHKLEVNKDFFKEDTKTLPIKQ